VRASPRKWRPGDAIDAAYAFAGGGQHKSAPAAECVGGDPLVCLSPPPAGSFT
jgi:hypothetical protein